jgi:putative hemolysin
LRLRWRHSFWVSAALRPTRPNLVEFPLSQWSLASPRARWQERPRSRHPASACTSTTGIPAERRTSTFLLTPSTGTRRASSASRVRRALKVRRVQRGQRELQALTVRLALRGRRVTRGPRPRRSCASARPSPGRTRASRPPSMVSSSARTRTAAPGAAPCGTTGPTVSRSTRSRSSRTGSCTRPRTPPLDGEAYLRIFLNNDNNDVIFDPTQCETFVPAKNVFTTFEVVGSSSVRYDDDSCVGGTRRGRAS